MAQRQLHITFLMIEALLRWMAAWRPARKTGGLPMRKAAG